MFCAEFGIACNFDCLGCACNFEHNAKLKAALLEQQTAQAMCLFDAVGCPCLLCNVPQGKQGVKLVPRQVSVCRFTNLGVFILGVNVNDEMV